MTTMKPTKPEKTYWTREDIDEFAAFANKAKSFLAWATACVIICTVAFLAALVVIVAKVLAS